MRCLTWRTSRICEANSTLGCRSLRSRHIWGWFAGLTNRLSVVRCAHATFGVGSRGSPTVWVSFAALPPRLGLVRGAHQPFRSEEHTSELQSRENLVCRLLLENKKYYTRNVNSRR